MVSCMTLVMPSVDNEAHIGTWTNDYVFSLHLSLAYYPVHPIEITSLLEPYYQVLQQGRGHTSIFGPDPFRRSITVMVQDLP